MKYLTIGAALTALVGGGAALAITQSGEAETPVPKTDIGAPLKQLTPEPKSGQPDRPGGKAEAEVFGPDSELIKKVKIGMSSTEVVAAIGPADYCDEESTDFGNDVSCWYGAWLVWTSDSIVQSVTYYQSEA